MPKGFEDLYKEVIKKDKCCVCGACVVSCPKNLLDFRMNVFYEADVKESAISKKELREIKDGCIQCNLCYNVCPSINFDLGKAEKEQFGEIKYLSLGNVHSAYQGQAANIDLRNNSQSGGVTSGLITYLLENDIVEGVLVARGLEENIWKPCPFLLTRENLNIIDSTQKTKYFPAAILSGLAEHNLEKIAIVATPCQLHALSKMKMKKFRKFTKKIYLTIGMFCFGTYSYNQFLKYIHKKYDLLPEDIKKFSLDRDSFSLLTESDHLVNDERKKLMKFVRGSCKKCKDYTNALADISIGSIDEELSAVLVRNEKADSIVKNASNGFIKIESLDDKYLKDIYQKARLKFLYDMKSSLKMSQEKLDKKIKTNGFDLPTYKFSNLLMINIITRDGIPVYSKEFQDIASSNDDSLLLSGLVAAMMRMTESILGEGSNELKRIDIGQYNIAFETGNLVNIFAVTKTKEDQKEREILKILINEVESKFGDSLTDIIDASTFTNLDGIIMSQLT